MRYPLWFLRLLLSLRLLLYRQLRTTNQKVYYRARLNYCRRDLRNIKLFLKVTSSSSWYVGINTPGWLNDIRAIDGTKKRLLQRTNNSRQDHPRIFYIELICGLATGIRITSCVLHAELLRLSSFDPDQSNFHSIVVCKFSNAWNMRRGLMSNCQKTILSVKISKARVVSSPNKVLDSICSQSILWVYHYNACGSFVRHFPKWSKSKLCFVLFCIKNSNLVAQWGNWRFRTKHTKESHQLVADNHWLTSDEGKRFYTSKTIYNERKNTPPCLSLQEAIWMLHHRFVCNDYILFRT